MHTWEKPAIEHGMQSATSFNHNKYTPLLWMKLQDTVDNPRFSIEAVILSIPVLFCIYFSGVTTIAVGETLRGLVTQLP